MPSEEVRQLKIKLGAVKRTKKEYDYYRNITEASEGIEWEVPLVELGVSGFESTDLAMQIKLTTTLTEKKSDVCDESGWFVPYKF